MTTSEQQSKGNALRTPTGTEQQPGQARQPWVWFLALSVAILPLLYTIDAARDTQTAQLPYSEFLEAVEDGHVAEVTLRGEHIQGRLKDRGQQATRLAHRIVGHWGMSPTSSPVAFPESQ